MTRRNTNIAVAVAAAFVLGGLVLPGRRVEGFDVASLLLAASSAVLGLAAIPLMWWGGWSFRAGVVLAGVGLFSLGGLILPDLQAGLMDAASAAWGLEVVRPWWLTLLAGVPFVVFVGQRGLSGLGPRRKWLAIGLRALIVALLSVSLAEPRIRRSSEHLTVLFVLDRSLSIPTDPDPVARGPDGDPIDRRWERTRRFVTEAVRFRGPIRRDDRAGVILFGRRPKLVLPPAAVDSLPVDDRLTGGIDPEYTDIAAALKLAMASFPEGAAKRIVLISDGNENLGRAEEQAVLARHQGVPIDVVPLAVGYKNEGDILVQGVEVPPAVAVGERLPVRVLIRNPHPTRVVDGVLELVQLRDREVRAVAAVDGPQILQKPIGAGPVTVRLRPGLNVFAFRDRAEDATSSFTYRATFTPLRSADPDGRNAVAGAPGDRAANNRATAAVVARSQRRVLLLDDPESAGRNPHRLLVDTLREAKFRVDRLAADSLPVDPAELAVVLSNFDCLILANAPADAFTPDQMEVIRASVSDQGMGLVMIGGPASFGPGGYQKTPVEESLPVTCDITSPEAVGKGGLVLIMHASEMADGNHWQKEIAKLAINKLGPVDMVGVLYYGADASWYIPFQTVGADGSRFSARLDKMTPGDMPDFDPFLGLAVDTLTNPAHGLAVKHTIIISDGDPIYGVLGQAAVARMAAGGVTCSTVGVATHGAAEDSRMKSIAEKTQGKFYRVADPSKLPAIYVREARRVSQSFLYTQPFVPALRLRGGPTTALSDALPPLHGFVRTTLRPDAFVEMAIEGPPQRDSRFPILAYRQYRAGRTVAFTSDARTQPGGVRGWDQEWVGSDLYQKFWEQVVGWAMRSVESGRLAVYTEYRDGRARVTVDVRDEQDRPVPGVSVRGSLTPVRSTRADGPRAAIDRPITFERTAPGRFEAEVPAEEAGAYLVNTQVVRDGKVIDGARAGVTVPYSPEFADLEPNPALLRRLAELTGGTVYTEGDAELQAVARSGEVFRDAPKTVRSLSPIWFWLVVAAGLLLVVDVGARRISLEPAEVREWAGRVWSRLRRSRAPTTDEPTNLDRLTRARDAAREALDRDRAGQRFDPETAPPPRPAEEAPPAPPSAPPVASPPPPAAEPAGDFLTRMREAKKRARQDRQEGEGG